jgi:two-component system, OmpR family, response regulator
MPARFLLNSIPMRVLLIEDDTRVADHVCKGLAEAGHTSLHCSDGRQGLLQANTSNFDVIILDRMLPELDGMAVLKTLRTAGNRTPVLLLSALGDVDQRVAGLRAGGDDYLAKPFVLQELLARVEVLARRTPAPAEPGRLTLGDLEMDLLGRQICRAGRRIDVTAREFRILEYLLRNTDRVVTRSMLLEQVWDYHFDPQTNIIDQHVSRLRQKLEQAGTTPLIQTVRGVGYMVRGS